jgi:hypothetical protein
MSATVIIPTTGSPVLHDAIKSVLNQTYDTKCYVVADGKNSHAKTKIITDEYNYSKKVERCYLPINVGADGFYGHRVYASFPHLVDTKYVLFLDQDNFFDENHVQSCIDLIESKNLDWCYTLRKIVDKNKNYLCNDDCESLGKWQTYHGSQLVDTSTYCLKTEVAIKSTHIWHMKWGADRLFPSVMFQHFPKYDCTGEYTLNYRMDGNPGSVNVDFFMNGNKVMNDKYNGVFPWRKI